MIRIAIVEDEQQHVDRLQAFLDRFAAEHETMFSTDVFYNGITIVENYSGRYDVIFLDIQMAHMDGMEAARRIRALDESVILIFVTSLVQYAVEGYNVRAADYLLKPINYPEFMLKFNRVYPKLSSKAPAVFSVPTENGTIKLSADDILYCEIANHRLLYHTTRGILSQLVPLKAIESQLPPERFARCNNCYLVNLDYVQRVDRDTVTVGNAEQKDILQISRNKKKAFENAFLARHASKEEA